MDGVSERPLFVETPVFTAGEAGVCEYRIPAMVCTNAGKLLAVCDARVERPGDAPNNVDLALKRSEDLGETWSAVEILIDDGGDMAACDPCMLVDRATGTVWIVYDHVYPTMDELRRRDPAGLDFVAPGFFEKNIREKDGAEYDKPAGPGKEKERQAYYQAGDQEAQIGVKKV